MRFRHIDFRGPTRVMSGEYVINLNKVLGIKRVVSILVLATVIGAVSGMERSVAAPGAESATISGPNIAQPIEILEAGDDESLRQVMTQTALWYGNGESERLGGRPPGDLGPKHALTWEISGPQSTERTIKQELYLEAKGGPVIHNAPQAGLASWGSGVVGWFAAPSELRDTLRSLGVPVRANDDASHLPLLVMGATSLAIVSILGVTFAIKQTRLGEWRRGRRNDIGEAG